MSEILRFILAWIHIIGLSLGQIKALDAAIFCGAALLSGLLVEVIRRWALRQERFDHPNERSSHTVPTPRGGGLAIVVVTLTGWILVNVFVWHRFDWWVWAYPLGAGLIAAVSWIDDLRSLPNSVRFAAHSVGAIIAILAYGYFLTVIFPTYRPVFLGIGGIVFTLLWITWLTNAYNFMDGIDGIAGLQALVAGLGWFSIIVLMPFLDTAEHENFRVNLASFDCIVLLGTLIAGSSLGFLFHNRPPARIFMGDVGSAFLGYSFAVMPLLLSGDWDYDLMRAAGQGMLVWPAILFVWPFLFDTIFTFIRRALKRENVFKAHRSHLFQRLVISGLSHRFVTLLYGILALEGAFFAINFISSSPLKAWMPLLLSMFGLWAFTRGCEMRKLRSTANSETQI